MGLELAGVCGVCPGLTVGDGVLRLGEEGGLMSAVLLLCLCVVAGMCGDASGPMTCVCVPGLYVFWGLRVGDKGVCFGCVGLCVSVCLFCVDMSMSPKVCVYLNSWVVYVCGEGYVCLSVFLSVLVLAALCVCLWAYQQWVSM